MERLSLTLGILVVISVSLHPVPVPADVYKWQDEKGKWHFGDKPPNGVESKQISTGASADTGTTKDLAGKLVEESKPQTPIESATLAVVTVETTLGKGAGFFISADGHLLTNRHVVRPTDTSFWAHKTERIEELELELEDMKAQVAQAYAPVKDLENEIADLTRAIEREESSSKRNQLRERLQRLEPQYADRKNTYYKLKAEFKTIKREFDKFRSDFEIKSNTTIVSSNFKIFLKNGDTLRARLVALSDTDDLALLKVDDVKSPYLEAAPDGALTQGARVFAIGSPLGLHDTVTAGVATNINDTYIGTDAKILPGSSGGPLLTEDGYVVGINTLKISGVAGAEGFGIAIPFERAESTFDW